MTKTTKEELIELQDQHAKMGKKIKALELSLKANDAWPQYDDRYLYVSSQGDICGFKYNGGDFDQDCQSLGNMFRTEEEAEHEVKRRKVTTKLKSMTNGFVPNWDDRIKYKWYLRKYENDLECDYHTIAQHLNTVYFATEEDAQKAIDTLGPDGTDELKYLLGE